MTEQKLLKVLRKAYPWNIVRVSWQSYWCQQGPDGIMDETTVEVLNNYKEKKPIWRVIFYDFTYDATGSYDPDSRWAQITEDNVKEFGAV